MFKYHRRNCLFRYSCSCLYLLFICPSNCIRLFLFINRTFMYRSYTSDSICSFHPTSAEIACSNAYVTHICAVHTANMYVSILFIERICILVFCSYSRSFTTPLKSGRAGPRSSVQLPQQYNNSPFRCTSLLFAMPPHRTKKRTQVAESPGMQTRNRATY